MNAQVGIKTTDPQATLDVNGDARIVNTPIGSNDAAKDSILAVDGSGFVKRITSEQIYTEIVDNIRNEITATMPQSFVKGNFGGGSGSVLNLSLALLDDYSLMEFDNEVFDENNDFDTSNHYFTAPADGIYDIYVQYKLNAFINVDELGVAILKQSNGSSSYSILAQESYLSVTINLMVGAIDVTPPIRKARTLAKLNAGDRIYFAGISTLQLSLLSSPEDSFFTIYQVK